MNITTRMNQDFTILDCSGTRLEGDSVLQWRDAIVKELEGGAKKLLINLEGVEYIGSDAARAYEAIMLDRARGTYDATIALLTPNIQPLEGPGASDLLKYDRWRTERDAVPPPPDQSSHFEVSS